jgi:hypothetical protein
MKERERKKLKLLQLLLLKVERKLHQKLLPRLEKQKSSHQLMSPKNALPNSSTPSQSQRMKRLKEVKETLPLKPLLYVTMPDTNAPPKLLNSSQL